jgi:hypothetical protein
VELERGIVFIAAGAAFVKDAERSAHSAKRQHPDLPICLFSDVPSEDPVFDIRREIKNPHRRSKLDCIIQSPFHRTLYLDTDTRVVGSIVEPFALLDRYDFAACHVENRHPVTSVTARLKADGVEPGFTGFNGGVFYYRMTDGVRRFFEAWAEEFKTQNARWDQPILRKLLWMMPDVTVIALPPEYNVRTVRGLLFRSRNESQVRIIHWPYFKSGDSLARRLWRTLRTMRFDPCNLVALWKALRS